MKKSIFALLLVFTLALSLVACNDNGGDTPTPSGDNSVPYNSTIENTKNSIRANETVEINNIAKITFEGASFAQQIFPKESNSVLYYKDIDNQTYLVIKGKIENISDDKLGGNDGTFFGELVIDKNSGRKQTMSFATINKNGSLLSLEPSESGSFFIFASVYDENVEGLFDGLNMAEFKNKNELSIELLFSFIGKKDKQKTTYSHEFTINPNEDILVNYVIS